MKTFLSIDWDYFIDATAYERAMMFPDGGNENLPDFLLDLIWISRYEGSIRAAEHRMEMRRITDIGVLEKELQLLTDYLEERGLRAVVAESHREAHDLFLSHLSAKEKFNLVNIDFHHDLYKNRAGIVDCGNWISELLSAKRINELTWVARSDSGELPKLHDKNKYITVTDDLGAVLSAMDEPDCVFICRSGVWSPPHLDERLNELIIKADAEPLFDRYTKEFKEEVKNISKQINDLLK